MCKHFVIKHNKNYWNVRRSSTIMATTLVFTRDTQMILCIPFCVDPFKGCWYLCEGGKVLRELPPHFFHHWKEVQKYTLPSFNTIVISGEFKEHFY